MTGRVALLTDASMETHRPPGHPERPERLAAVAAGVGDAAREIGAELTEPLVEPAHDRVIGLIHPAAYLAALDDVAARGGGWLDSDTYLGPSSMAAARVAAGATVAAAVTVARGEAEVAFAVGRPPGHHAWREHPGGFCLLNNVAVAVAALREAGLANRVAIVDWDVHHGDGTQSIFDADPQVWFASTHQFPLYPGTGSPAQRGSGPAVGTKHNRTLAPGDGDEEFVEVWTLDLLPELAAFEPEAILVSAGFDAHRHDPLAQLKVTEQGYRRVAQALGALTTAAGLRGVALTLEGGYDLDALRASAAAAVSGLLVGLAGSSTAEG